MALPLSFELIKYQTKLLRTFQCSFALMLYVSGLFSLTCTYYCYILILKSVLGFYSIVSDVLYWIVTIMLIRHDILF